MNNSQQNMNNSQQIIPDTMPYSLEDIQNCKDITLDRRLRDWNNLKKFKADINPRKFCGNPLIYHHQYRNLIKTRRGDRNYKTIEDIWKDEDEKQKLWDESVQRNRRDKSPYPSVVDVFECHRINRGSIVIFKSSTAKYIYKMFNCKNVLDPTAGWGGRLLGAGSLGIKYTGIDTNLELKEGYDNMIKECNIQNCEMIWKSCFDVDYKTINPDLVLTSPPYSNMELYQGMKPWVSDDEFYTKFLIPLLDKLEEETCCPVCINMSPKMYKTLIKKYGRQECNEKIDVRQQLGQQYKTKSQDYVYVWKPTDEKQIKHHTTRLVMEHLSNLPPSCGISP